LYGCKQAANIADDWFLSKQKTGHSHKYDYGRAGAVFLHPAQDQFHITAVLIYIRPRRGCA